MLKIEPPSPPRGSLTLPNDVLALPQSIVSLTTAGPILVATDGSLHADPAFAAAAAMADHTGAEVEIFAVLEPPPHLPRNVFYDAFGADEAEERDALELGAQSAILRTAVEAQLALTVGHGNEWPITVAAGPLGVTSRRIANDRNASIIMVGRHRHSLFGRLAGEDGAMHIMEWVSAPVYIAPTGARAVPVRVVVATDFSPASIRAAHTVSRLVGDSARVYLVYVAPALDRRQRLAPPCMTMDEARTKLERLGRTLPLPMGVAVQPIVLFGRPAAEVLAFADGIYADVVACGTVAIAPSMGLRDRLHVGSVATEIVTKAACAVLVTPDPTHISRTVPM